MTGLHELEILVNYIRDDQLDWSEHKDGWHIQHVRHLTDDDNAYTLIVKHALASPRCKGVFGGFPCNKAWADQLGCELRPVDQAVALTFSWQNWTVISQIGVATRSEIKMDPLKSCLNKAVRI